MLKGYITLITGATSGLGLATAEEFIAQGATVIGVGRNFSRVEGMGENFIPFPCDVSDEAQLDSLVKFVEEKFGVLDTLICNAGSSFKSTVSELDSEAYDAASRLLLKAPMLLTSRLYPLLCKSEHASISHTASIAGTMIGASVLYNVNKAALINFTRQSANALGKDGIRVNAITPGLIRTNLLPEAVWAAWEKDPARVPALPIKRIGDAWEVAKLFAFLSSEKASYVTGAVIPIDGGWYLTHPRSVPLP